MKDVKQSTRLRPLTNQELIDSYDYLSGAASSQDCTGLIPSAPLSEAELDSYALSSTLMLYATFEKLPISNFDLV